LRLNNKTQKKTKQRRFEKTQVQKLELKNKIQASPNKELKKNIKAKINDKSQGA
jgi:hypothetical protein